MKDPVTYFVLVMIGSAVGLIFKILWDWFKSGRVEKGLYVKIEDCSKIRERCCVSTIKKELAEERRNFESYKNGAQIQMMAIEKRLDDGRENFKEFQADIGEIKEALASLVELKELIRDLIKNQLVKK